MNQKHHPTIIKIKKNDWGIFVFQLLIGNVNRVILTGIVGIFENHQIVIKMKEKHPCIFVFQLLK